MGVERAVTRWYVRQQALLREIDGLQERLKQLPLVEGEAVQPVRIEVEHQLAHVQAQITDLGPCPRPMMG